MRNKQKMTYEKHNKIFSKNDMQQMGLGQANARNLELQLVLPQKSKSPSPWASPTAFPGI